MGGEAVDTGTRWTVTNPQGVARHTALVMVVVAMMYGHLWTRGLEWVGLVEGVMRQIAGS